MTTTNDEDYIRRATNAYFKTDGQGATQPSNTSGVAKHNGRAYAVLKNVAGTLAVYRIQPRGSLKRLRRWPSAVA